MIIDAHAHIWKGRIEESGNVLLDGLDRYGIDRVYVSGLGELVPDADEIRHLNDATAELMKKDSRVYGYCYLNPRHNNTMDELQRGIETQGMSGVKLWVSVFCDDPCVYPIVERCIEYDVPLLIHAFYKAVGQLPNETLGTHVANLAKRYREAKILMAHMGASCHRELKPIRFCENVWTDYSGTLFRRDDLDYAKECLGAKRIVFGTDADLASPLLKLGQLDDADFTNEEKQLVLCQNALDLFGE